MPRKLRETDVERRLRAGATVVQTFTGDPAQPVRWEYSDDGKAARGDVIARLQREGKLRPAAMDGLFPEMAQTWALAR